jgi:hypothetical protein
MMFDYIEIDSPKAFFYARSLELSNIEAGQVFLTLMTNSKEGVERLKEMSKRIISKIILRNKK